MIKDNVFLSRFFVTFVAFFCCIRAADADAPTQITPKKTISTERIICPKNSYVSKCGNYYVGTNWLKGFTSVNGEKTPDYFDYSDNADEINMKNLRIFFTISANETNSNISFTPEDIAIEQNTVDENSYKTYRNKILKQFCNYNIVTCAPCPGNGKTESESKFNLINKSWSSFNTIAHCYMNEYTDSTGTYINVNKTGEQENCYFEVGVNYMGGTILGQSNSTSTIESAEDSATSLPSGAPGRR